MSPKLAPRSKRWRCALAAIFLLSLFTVLSCSNLGYYGQAVWGQTRILVKRQGIEKLVADSATPADLRGKLESVLRIRDFAVRELSLPDNGSYESYVELAPGTDGQRRRYAVWNVVAAPELSVLPLVWCFPVAGCVSYRGYFSEKRARRFAGRLVDRGYDVAVSGATAYSTLGWFKDPVLSTVIDYPEAYLAGLLFHELAHQVVYVKDDTRFNESFATAVEIEGVRRWIDATGRDSSVLEDYLARMRREEKVVELVLDYGERLGKAYGRESSVEWKRRRKAELFEDLKRALGDLRDSWGGASGYDAWLDRELNNAHLASIGAYHGLVPGFRRLIERHGDLGDFYEAVRELAALDPEERERRLTPPLPRSLPPPG